ncbi:MAG: ankyrin repeat domain-containing protein [Gemmatimonadota bacterium]|nr:ankyrin repeat domain-containing protein [Gemmatimonadota bacterium]
MRNLKLLGTTAALLPLFAHPASAQEDCEGWNSGDFFRNATAESVAACLEAGADVNARTDSTFDTFFYSGVFGHYTPLHFATNYSWDGMVTVLLAAGAEVDARDLSGETPLHWAAGRSRNPAVITELVEAGADLNARDGEGNTPLHASRRNTNPAVALLLLELGADPAMVNDSGRVASPMDCSYWNTEEFARVATADATAACLAAGADVGARDEDEYTPLLLATYHGGGGTGGGSASEMTAVVTVLLEAGADVNARGNVQNTALHHAAGGKYVQRARDRYDHVETPDVVAALLAAGADVNARDLNGNRPLHHAASAEGVETVTMLIQAGADIRARDSEGNTPLLMAAYRGFRNPEIVEVLVEAGADVNDRNERGETVLERALRSPADRVAGVVRRLLDLGADATEPGLMWQAAVQDDNAEVITVLLAAGADVNPPTGSAPLHGAARGGGPGVIEALVAAGAEVDARGGRGMTPLHQAVERKKPDNVTALLEAGADVHLRMEDGDTPLHMAAVWPRRFGSRDDDPRPDTLMVIALVAAGADVNARNDRGETPLHVASRNRHQPVVDKLLELGADPAAVDDLGRAPRPTVCNWTRNGIFRFAPWQSVLGCLQAGADVHARGEGGGTPLHHLVSEAMGPPQLPPSHAEPDEYPFDRIVAAFVAAGADVNARDRGGGTPLHSAAERFGNPSVLAARALLDAGADVNARDSRGGTPLHRPAGLGWPDDDALVSLLVEAGAGLHATDDEGRTALHYAVRYDSPANAAKLIELGADTAARDDSGHVANPLDCARLNTATFFHLAPTETVAGCIEGGADVHGTNMGGSTPLHSASVWARDPAVVSLLVEAGAEVDARNGSAGSPLHTAARSTDHPAMIGALVEAGAEVDAWIPGIHSPYGWTPLHLAAGENRNPAVTAALIEAGADVHARQEDGPTPLHDAATAEVVALLLEAGADIEARATYVMWRQPNGRDMTPLHVAAKRGNAAVFMALLEAGADPSALDIEGKTPLDHARENKALRELEVMKRSAR